MKKFLILILIISISFVFISCASFENITSNLPFAQTVDYPEEIIGTWEGTWENNGNSIKQTLKISDDGYYQSTTYINNTISEQCYGLWELDSTELHCYRGKNWSSIYRFENNVLSSWDEDGTEDVTIYTKRLF